MNAKKICYTLICVIMAVGEEQIVTLEQKVVSSQKDVSSQKVFFMKLWKYILTNRSCVEAVTKKC